MPNVFRSPKDEAERNRPHCTPISQEAAAIERLREEIKSIFEWFKSNSNLVTKYDLRELKEEIMATQAELAADLKAVLAQQVKTAAEIASVQAAQTVALDKIAELEALINAGGTVTQELIDAVAEVKTQAQIVDDLIPDLVPPVEPTP